MAQFIRFGDSHERYNGDDILKYKVVEVLDTPTNDNQLLEATIIIDFRNLPQLTLGPFTLANNDIDTFEEYIGNLDKLLV